MKLVDKVKIAAIGLATAGVIACSAAAMYYTSCEYASKSSKLQVEVDSIKHIPSVANYLDATQELKDLPTMHYFGSRVHEENFNKSVQAERESLQKIIDETLLSPVLSYQNKVKELKDLEKEHQYDNRNFINVALLSFLLGGFGISKYERSSDSFR